MSIGSVGSTVAGLTYDVAVAKKQLNAQEDEGRQALQLIQAAQPPQSAPTASVGTRLDVVA